MSEYLIRGIELEEDRAGGRVVLVHPKTGGKISAAVFDFHLDADREKSVRTAILAGRERLYLLEVLVTLPDKVVLDGRELSLDLKLQAVMDGRETVGKFDLLEPRGTANLETYQDSGIPRIKIVQRAILYLDAIVLNLL